MSICDGLLSQLGFEADATRTLFERIPDRVAGFKPHPRSTALGDLALHIATIVGWAAPTMNLPELDLAPPGGPAYASPTFTTMAATLTVLEANVAAARAAITGKPDSAMMEPWSLKAGGQVIFAHPRIAVMRGFVLSHLIHHRGQLTVYLRMNDIPLPPLYGPTADEQIPAG